MRMANKRQLKILDVRTRTGSEACDDAAQHPPLLAPACLQG